MVTSVTSFELAPFPSFPSMHSDYSTEINFAIQYSQFTNSGASSSSYGSKFTLLLNGVKQPVHTTSPIGKQTDEKILVVYISHLIPYNPLKQELYSFPICPYIPWYLSNFQFPPKRQTTKKTSLTIRHGLLALRMSKGRHSNLSYSSSILIQRHGFFRTRALFFPAPTALVTWCRHVAKVGICRRSGPDRRRSSLVTAGV